jgi:Asp-tRNA(Asn)/Glu-tRNA(Gln) amidotransferase A subunit family amidase
MHGFCRIFELRRPRASRACAEEKGQARGTRGGGNRAHRAAQPQLNAVVFKAYDEARAKATAKLSGPFAGVPMLLKDILGAKKGWPTRQGSRFASGTLSVRRDAGGTVRSGRPHPAR